jgi:hypothetical protein
MIELRWLIKKRHITADLVRAHADRYQVSMMEAKRLLEQEATEKLQYRVKQDVTVWAGMPTPEQRAAMANYIWSEWIDVPTITEIKKVEE